MRGQHAAVAVEQRQSRFSHLAPASAAKAGLALLHGDGGVLSSHVSLVLRTE